MAVGIRRTGTVCQQCGVSARVGQSLEGSADAVPLVVMSMTSSLGNGCLVSHWDSQDMSVHRLVCDSECDLSSQMLPDAPHPPADPHIPILVSAPLYELLTQSRFPQPEPQQLLTVSIASSHQAPHNLFAMGGGSLLTCTIMQLISTSRYLSLHHCMNSSLSPVSRSPSHSSSSQ